MTSSDRRLRLPVRHQPPFPGAAKFGPGRSNSWILMLRLRLIVLGYADDQTIRLDQDPRLVNASVWDDRLRSAYTRYQLDLGLRGDQAHGYPTRETWWRLWG
jgi:hypothetical protein